MRYQHIGPYHSDDTPATLNFSATIAGKDSPTWFFSEVPLGNLHVFVMNDMGDTIQHGLS